MVCTLHQILLGGSSQRGLDGRSIKVFRNAYKMLVIKPEGTLDNINLETKETR
jgi:hypothetical protein